MALQRHRECSDRSTAIDEFPAVRSLAVASGGSLFGHGGQHLADVGGQEVVHFIALRDEDRRRFDYWDVRPQFVLCDAFSATNV